MAGSRCCFANSMIKWRRVLMNASGATIRPPLRSRANAVIAASISASLCTGDAESSTASDAGPKLTQEDRIIRRGVGIEQKRHASDAGGNLLEHLQPFPYHRKVDEREAGDVAAGTRQSHHETLSDRIVDDAEHD